MTQDELKLVLEFVESINLGSRSASVEQQRQVITAIKEALAQPEQEPVVMWDGKYQIEFGNLSAYKHGEHSWIPLYTTPPQRPWVGLTDEEQRNIAYSDINCWDWGELMDAVEAKLKKKNGYAEEKNT